MGSFRAARAAVAAAALALVPTVLPAGAQAATPAHGSVVQSRSSAVYPQLVASTPAPHIDAIAVGGGTTYVGGTFTTMTQGGTQVTGLGNLAAFSSTNGTFTSFSASTNGQVNDLALDGNALYVAGDFTTVNGEARSGLAKLNATTGELIREFRAPGGKVNDVDVVSIGGVTHVFAGGPNKGLFSLSPATGARDSYSIPAFTDKIPGSWGVGISVYRFAVDPSGTRVAAVGDFQTVGGQPRTRFALLNLGANGATVNPWYYSGFSKPCGSTNSRRIAYLQGVDWSPNGQFLNFAATGQISKPGDVWHYWMTDAQKAGTTVCDAVGRFSLAQDVRPEWINYTGGDSIWRVQDTGAAVYASGHFQWMDNPDGFASQGTGDRGGNGQPGFPAVRRLGIGAINPTTGRALDWAPQASGFKQGGKALLANAQGLWIGNDSKRFGGQPRFGFAFAPLP